MTNQAEQQHHADADDRGVVAHVAGLGLADPPAVSRTTTDVPLTAPSMIVASNQAVASNACGPGRP